MQTNTLKNMEEVEKNIYRARLPENQGIGYGFFDLKYKNKNDFEPNSHVSVIFVKNEKSNASVCYVVEGLCTSTHKLDPIEKLDSADSNIFYLGYVLPDECNQSTHKANTALFAMAINKNTLDYDPHMLYYEDGCFDYDCAFDKTKKYFVYSDGYGHTEPTHHYQGK